MTEIESEKEQYGESVLYMFVEKPNKMLCKISFYIFSILSLLNESTFIWKKGKLIVDI